MFINLNNRGLHLQVLNYQGIRLSLMKFWKQQQWIINFVKTVSEIFASNTIIFISILIKNWFISHSFLKDVCQTIVLFRNRNILLIENFVIENFVFYCDKFMRLIRYFDARFTNQFFHSRPSIFKIISIIYLIKRVLLSYLKCIFIQTYVLY